MSMRTALRDDTGAMAIVIAVTLSLVMFAIAAFVINVGSVEAGRREMQTAADAGALAGVQLLPGNPSGAIGAAQAYAQNNGADPAKVTVSLAGSPPTSITVNVGSTAPLSFGGSTKPVGAAAVAEVGSPTGYGRGVMPFGVMSKNPSATAAFGYAFNEQVTLKQPAGQGGSGNYQFIDLVGETEEQAGGAPSSVYQPVAKGGVNEPVLVGERYYTQTGINGKQVVNSLAEWVGADSHAFDDIVTLRPDGVAEIEDWNCHRLIVCPIVVAVGPPVSYNWDDVNGTKLVQIIGFSWFYLEDWGTTGNDSWVTGRFIRPVSPTDPTGFGPISPWGAIGYRLAQ